MTGSAGKLKVLLSIRPLFPLILLLIHPLYSISSKADANTLRIGTTTTIEYPPFQWHNPCAEGQSQGMLWEMVSKALQNLDAAAQAVPITPQQRQPERLAELFKSNSLHAIFTVNDSDNKLMTTVQEPMFKVRPAVFVRASELADFTTLESLNQRDGMATLKTAHHFIKALQQRYPKALNKMKSNQDIARASTLLLENKIDYFITGRSQGRLYLAEQNLTKAIQRSAIALNFDLVVQFGIASNSAYAQYAQALSTEFLRMNKTGTTAALMKKHMQLWLSDSNKACVLPLGQPLNTTESSYNTSVDQ